MAFSRNFVYEKDADFGNLGLRPAWMATGNTTSEVSHDVLEHFGPNKLNPIEDELMALGAMLAVRGETGALETQYRSCEEQLAMLVSGVLQEIYEQDRPMPAAESSRALDDGYEWAERVIQRVAQDGIKHLDAWADDACNEMLFDIRSNAGHLSQAVTTWLRRGYRKAQKRYAGADLFTVGNHLTKKLDELSRRIVKSELVPYGATVTFRVDSRRLDVSFKIDGQPPERFGF